MKNKAIPIVMVAVIGICIFAPIVSAETAEERHEKGLSFGKAGEYEKAIEDLNKSIELNPNDAIAYDDRGFIYAFDLGKYEKAIEDFNKAIELDPNYIAAYFHRGNAYSFLGQFEKAIEDYSKVIASDPHHPGHAPTYEHRGVAYYFLKQYEKAIEDFDKAIELDPYYAKVYKVYETRELALSKLKEQKTAQTSTPIHEENGVPGFEAIFAIAGMLVVVCLIKRKIMKKS